jgi:hypothetical protein
MVQIRECGRTVAAEYVAFDIRWDGDLSGERSVLWSMAVGSEDGADTVRLGYQRTGDDVVQFVDDEASGRRAEVPQDADLGDDEITVRFPAEVVGVAAEWPVWRAVLVVDGEQVDERVANAG